ncbi:MAG TPA: hypothetical protein VGU25_09775 [Acidobacteriaceae bacterium]|nr:hypothetical protein [Acidobacteriaceae bacterium]
MHALIYSALAIALVCVCVGKWSVVKMVREINRLALPGGERLMPSMSLWWWPNYKDRRIWSAYRLLQPYSSLRWVYPGSLMTACLLIVAAVLVSAHAPGGVQ